MTDETKGKDTSNVAPIGAKFGIKLERFATQLNEGAMTHCACAQCQVALLCALAFDLAEISGDADTAAPLFALMTAAAELGVQNSISVQQLEGLLQKAYLSQSSLHVGEKPPRPS